MQLTVDVFVFIIAEMSINFLMAGVCMNIYFYDLINENIESL